MLFFVHAVVNSTVRAILKQESERRLRFETDRFQGQIGEIGVVLLDANGPRGGLDKVCRISTKLRRGSTLEIEAKASSFITAICGAVKRFRRLLARRIGGKRTQSSFRSDPYRRPWNLL